MEIITKREAEAVLKLLAVGIASDEIVSQITKTRLPNLAESIRRDVDVVLCGGEDAEEIMLCRTIWDVLKAKGK